MGLIENEGVVFRKQRVALGFGQENPVGHQLDASLRAAAVLETDLAADFTAPGDVELLGNAARNRERGHSARLGATNLGLDPQARLEAHLGKLRSLARAGLPGNDHDLAAANCSEDVLSLGGNGQLRRVADRGHMLTASLPQSHRGARLPQQPLQNSLVGVGVKTVPHEPHEPRAQPHPIRQHRLRQQRPDFLYSSAGHERSSKRTKRYQGLDASEGFLVSHPRRRAAWVFPLPCSL